MAKYILINFSKSWMALDDIKVHLKVKIFRKGFALDNLWPLV